MMKAVRSLLCGLLLLIGSTGCWAAYAHVQSVAANADTATITSSTAGTLLVFSVYTSGGGGRISTVTSGFTLVATELVGDYGVSVYAYPNNPGGITSVGVTAWASGTPGERRVYVSEYSGIATSSPVLTTASQTQSSPGTGTDAVTSGTSTVTLAGAPGALIYGFSGSFGSGITMNTGTGFTSRVLNDGNRVEDKRVTSDGSQAATYTAASAPATTYTWMVAFAEASAGGSSPIPIILQQMSRNEAANDSEIPPLLARAKQ